MQTKEMRNWTTEELLRRLGEANQEQFNLRREMSLGRLEDYTRVRAVKRDIARIKTLLRERELSAELAGTGEEVE
jgi:large subunit ribosomal protein L29